MKTKLNNKGKFYLIQELKIIKIFKMKKINNMQNKFQLFLIMITVQWVSKLDLVIVPFL